VFVIHAVIKPDIFAGVMLKKTMNQRKWEPPRTLLSSNGLYQQLQKSPIKDQSVLLAHKNHKFPDLDQMRQQTIILESDLRTTTLGTEAKLNSNLGATESLTSQKRAMAAIIRMLLMWTRRFHLLKQKRK
jgi:hypothetical protein